MAELAHKGAVFVTGASTGIGRACAVHLAGRGHRVFGTVRKDADADSLRAEHDAIHPLLMDVTDADAVEAAAQEVTDLLGDAPLLGIVNNAGVAVGGPLEYLALDDLRWQFEVNVFGLVAVTQAFGELLRRHRGRIVHISSMGGTFATPFMGPYAASKYAVEALADAQRRELRALGMHVVLVQPGTIATPIWDKAETQFASIAEKLSPAARERYRGGLKSFEAVIKMTASAGIPAVAVARAVEKGLTARHPKARYRVGWDAALGARISGLLPDRILDALVATQFKG